jgi:hypothetical protein
MCALLAANGIGSDDYIRWHLPHTRALALYVAIMTREGFSMEWSAERERKIGTTQAQFSRSVRAYLAQR